jgi:nucleoside-diphosphate-sugar epimerase
VKRVLVTGATGLLGAYVVSRLLKQGVHVRGLTRSPSARHAVEALGAEAVPGEMSQVQSLVAAAAGCDTIVHAAAAIATSRQAQWIRRVNVEGAGHVVTAAERAGSRLVHVSSTAVFGADRYVARPEETSPLPDLPAHDAYGRSKQEAERAVLAAHRAGRIWAAVVRPPVMYGRGDRQLAPRLGPIVERGVVPLVDGGTSKLALVHADAVAEGVIRVAGHDAAGGQVYHLTHDFDLTVAELVGYAALGLGRRVRTPHVPMTVARLASPLLQAALIACGRRDLASQVPGVLDLVTRNNPFSSTRARDELGWRPTVAPHQGVPEAFRWWREQRTRSGTS